MDLSKYYEQICKHPILTREEEFILCSKYVSPDTPEEDKAGIRDTIINANLRFAFKTAKNYSRNDPSMFEYLISAGNEGLLVGLEKYNPTRDVRFLSYVGWWVVQRILNEMSQMRIVSLPIWKQQLSSRILKFKDANETATFEDIKAAFPDISEKYIRELHETRYLTYYIEDMDEHNFLINPIEAQVEKAMDNELLGKAMQEMSQIHRDILIFSFGFHEENGKEMSPISIAKKLGVTRDQFKEYKKEAMAILRDKLNVEIEVEDPD
jgi:RNA polymerase primary sigma factor